MTRLVLAVFKNKKGEVKMVEDRSQAWNTLRAVGSGWKFQGLHPINIVGDSDVYGCPGNGHGVATWVTVTTNPAGGTGR